MKLIGQAFLFLLILAMVSCKKPPEYPTIPEISFVEITKKTTTIKKGVQYFPIDSVVINLSFKDGDGDLGTSGTSENYFCEVYQKIGDKYEQFKDTNNVVINKNGTFFDLNPDGRQGPLEGNLFYGPSLNFRGYVPDSTDEYTLKFKVYIKDNAGHSSNIVETTDVVVGLY